MAAAARTWSRSRAMRRSWHMSRRRASFICGLSPVRSGAGSGSETGSRNPEASRACAGSEFSPDGKDVAFYAFADQALMRMSVRDSCSSRSVMPDADRHPLGPERHGVCSGRAETASGLRQSTPRAQEDRRSEPGRGGARSVASFPTTIITSTRSRKAEPATAGIARELLSGPSIPRSSPTSTRPVAMRATCRLAT